MRPPVSEHAPIAPSSMARTVQCPGSVVMQQRYPEAEGPEAAEGTAAHWAFSEIARGALVALGQIAPNGVRLDEEMIESAELMANTVADWPGLAVEKTVAVPSLSPSLHAGACWGTPDALAWAVPRARLRVGDLKHGHGFVDAYENWQLMTYAWGAMDEAKINGAEELALIVELTIVQPRSYHRDGPVRTWTTTAADIRAHRNIAAAAAAEALGPNPRTIAGPECKHCTARHACETLQRAALDVIDQEGRAVSLDLPTPAAAHELRRLDYAIALAEARRTGLEAQLLAAARGGQAVPHFHVEHGEGREAWSVSPAEVFALGDLMGVDLRAEKPITPAQARKRGVDVPGFSARNTGEAKLVADSPHQAAKIFGKVSA